MNRCRSLSIAGLVLLAVPAVHAQAPASGAQRPVPAAFSQIYHVSFVQAAPGKLGELEKIMTAPAPGATSPGHVLLLRHREGSPWDFVSIEHIGATATVETGWPGPARELRAWHEDTFVAGPPWDVFAKAMGIDGKQAKAFTSSRCTAGLPATGRSSTTRSRRSSRRRQSRIVVSSCSTWRAGTGTRW